jgi:glutathione S-transferase
MVSSPAEREVAETTTSEDQDAGEADSFVCHRDDDGPRFHPCRRVQEALRGAGIEYRKVIAAHGSPIPFLRRGSRDHLFEATGTTKLPTLKLPDGTIISHSRAILAWVREQAERGDVLKQVA